MRRPAASCVENDDNGLLTMFGFVLTEGACRRFAGSGGKMMKPQTITRRAEERAKRRQAERADRIARLREKADRDGPNSIWAEMLGDYTPEKWAPENYSVSPP